MGAFVARPVSDDPTPGVLVLIEAFGLVGSIRDVACRLAGAGYLAIVPDLFYREAPHNTASYDDIPGGMALQSALVARGAAFLGDVAVALDWLDRSPAVAPGPHRVVGFCMGGALAFATAAGLPGRVGAAACFYGAGISNTVARAGGLDARLMFAYGEKDPYISADEVSAVRSGLEAKGIPFDLEVYGGADHGFMNDARPESFHPESAGRAWDRLLSFFGSPG
ncbi:MAG: dienelactone hydrolase family protein [Acidimicrobiales bacterium]